MTTPFYGKDGIYRSQKPPVVLPEDPNLSMVPFLFRNFPSLSQSTALIDAGTAESFTFFDLLTQVSKLSHALLKLNINKNDVVLIFSPNSVLFPISFLAVVAIGAIATTVNPLYTINELSNQVNDSNPKLIITVNELHHKIKHFNLPCILLSPKGSFDAADSYNTLFCHYSDLINSTSPASSDSLWSSAVQTDVAALLYSSGTTGKSKGVVLTHRNFIATASMVTRDQECYGNSKNVYLCFLPMFHIFGLSVAVYAQLQKGNTVVVMERYEMEKALHAVEKYKVTHMYAVPPVVVALGKQKKVVSKYDCSSLREIACGAAPLGKDVIEECAKNFPQAVIVQGYGMTETCGIISREDVKTGPPHSGSTGVLVPGVECKILDVDTAEPLPPFQKGQILVRGQNMMQGYFKNQIATNETIDKQGWVHTGDLGYFDDKGLLYVVDRIKELIKYKGFQVAPAELEELLLTHPEISDAAVIPLPDAEAGEIPVAFVVRSSNSSLTEREVQNFVAKQVTPYKRLHRVIFSRSIPKSASGKILRRKLRQRAQSNL
ncbi:probable CoA ligase CCL7 [Coffea arabica]|uniref:Probable CoA ligase CCL7 n=1 Tax=Coffea arabica TaxID=13443 RepID=A0ABM4ULY5_COFAR